MKYIITYAVFLTALYLGIGSLEKTDILNIQGEISIFSSYVPHEFKK
jgi:hypothetical protein